MVKGENARSPWRENYVYITRQNRSICLEVWVGSFQLFILFLAQSLTLQNRIAANQNRMLILKNSLRVRWMDRYFMND